MSRVRTFLVALLTLAAVAAPASAQQTGTVAGRVFDGASMRPLSGVVVSAGDLTALTNDQGRFSIANIPAGARVVTAQILGYARSETNVNVVAGQTTTIDIRLDSEALQLAEIVVTGYGESTSRDVTGVVEAVSADEFNTGRLVSPQELISGKVAGVQVIDSGEPGGGISLRIRGGTSINSSNEPLFVVDGVPIPVGGGLSTGRNPLNFLNPNDIESVTVLKDASAAAIYGSRGANGVVLIETKSGRGSASAGEGATLTYTGTVSRSSILDDVNMLNAQQFANAVQTYQPGNTDLLAGANTDWRDLITRDGFGQEHSIAVAGVGATNSYRLSLGLLDQQGVVRESEVERVTAAFNMNQLLFNDQVSIDFNFKGSRAYDIYTPGGVLGSATNMAPTSPVLDPNSQFGGFWEWADPLGVNNPMGQLALIEDEGSTLRGIGSARIEADLPWVTGLTLTSDLAYDVTKTERFYFEPSFSKGQAESGNDGTVSRNLGTLQTGLFDAYLTYIRPIGESNDLELTGGYSYEDERGDYPSFFAQQLSFDLLGPNGIPAAELERTFMNVQESKLISFFGRMNYSIDDTYLFTGSIRRDGSSRFGEENRWGIFPSAAFAWRLTNEGFLADNQTISDLKFRVSWGVNGNQSFANYQFFSNYVIGDPLTQTQFGDDFVTTIRPSAADPNLKWEETTSTNIGFDFGLFADRFTGSIEYYQKDTEDLIFTVPVPAGTNLSNQVTTNIGAMQNRGVEFSIEGALIQARDEGGFEWNAAFNAASNDNELVRVNASSGGGERILTGGIAGGVGSNIQVLQPGFPVNSFLVYQHRRNADGSPVYADTNGDNVINELDLYVDRNEDGVINQADREPYESPQADWLIGFSSFMNWGAFDASFTMRAQLGNHVYNNVASDGGHYSRLRGNALVNLHASVLENEFVEPQYFSDVYVEDASFLRMDNLTIGYTIRDGRFAGARIFGTVQNVFTLTGYSGIDPEAGLNGIDNNIYPRARTLTAGLSLGF